MTLSARRQEMFVKLTDDRLSEEGEAPGRRAAEFDYRRGVSDDIEVILRSALDWSIINPGARLRPLADEITRYILG